MAAPLSDPTEWFTEHVLPHEPLLRAWLRADFPSLTDLDDLVQETFSRVVHAWVMARSAPAPTAAPIGMLASKAHFE